MIIGMDFGTTNTGAAWLDGQRVRLLSLDPGSASPEVCRSAIYMTRTGDYYLGSGAMDAYFAQNIGRPTRYRKVWIGEIIQIFAELPVFYRDVYVYEDEFSPGRLFTSIKTALRSRDYFGTAFRGAWFNASDLVAIFLMGMKMHMEQQLGGPVKEIVLGRPVHFSSDPAEDKVAQSRLLDAAFKAGFERVFLEYEPVAAALAYERELSSREVVLVFDFGGGTLDFTVMEVGGRQRRGGRRVLATGGVPIAGDVFDQRLFRSAIPRHLGEGLEYLSGNVRRPIPAHIFDTLAQPHEILSLNTPQNLEMLQSIHAGSLDPEKTHALLKVVSANYALMMFDLVERAKRQLSDDYTARLVVETPDFSFRELVTRPTFERAIAFEAEMIQAELLATMQRAGIKPEKIDRVIRTGGSSQIPLFVNLLGDLFGYEKVRAIDTFSSVTSGLAIRGQQLAKAQVDLPAYTPASEGRSSETARPLEHQAEDSRSESQTELRARPIELDAVLKRLQVQQEARLEPEHLPERLIFVVNQAGVYAANFDLVDRQAPVRGRKETEWIDLAEIFNPLPTLQPGAQCTVTRLEAQLLLITDQYKLISAPARELYLAQQADPQGIAHSLPLDVDERVAALMVWEPDTLQLPLVCLLTAAGQGRAFDSAMLANAIARRPYFQLERRYTGKPAALFPALSGATLLIGTDLGRVARAALGELTIQPVDLLRLRADEWLRAWLAVLDTAPAAAVNSHGGLLVFDAGNLPLGKPPAQRAQYIRRNFPIVGLFSLSGLAERRTYALSNLGRLHRLDLPAAETSAPDGARRLVKLAAHETLLACCHLSE